MLLSHYARIFPWPEDTSLRLLFSSRTGAVALVSAEILAEIEADTLDHESASTLGDLGLLVEDHSLEKEEVASMVEEINRQRTAMNVSVIVNLHCNFRFCVPPPRRSLPAGDHK